jgi:chromosome partitioning protein
MTRSFAMLSRKGGVGKTTFTLNCAHALAFSGFRVLLVDLDAQSNLTKHLLRGERGAALRAIPDLTDIAKVLTQRRSVEEVGVNTGYAGLDLIPGSQDLEDLPLLNPRLAREPSRLRALLSPLYPRYDYVLVDCAPVMNWLTRMALMAVSRVIVPTQPEAYALQGLEDLVPRLDKMSATAQLYRIVINMYRGNTQLHQTMAAEIEAAWPGRVARQRVRLTIDVADAARAGKSIFEYAPASLAAVDMYALCFELFGLSAEIVRERTRERGESRRKAASPAPNAGK